MKVKEKLKAITNLKLWLSRSEKTKTEKSKATIERTIFA